MPTKQESPWVDRNSELRPDDGQQVLAEVQGWARADYKFEVTRYDAAKDLFACETHTSKVVRWTPIPSPGRRVRYDRQAWAAEFERRAGE
jgi:hypothetical protein